MPKTRKDVLCTVFGAFKQLNTTVLPTFCDVMKHYLYVRFELLQKCKKEPTFPEVANIVLRDVKSIWDKACLPYLSDRRIFQMLKDYFEKYKKVKKLPASRRNPKAKLFLNRAQKKLFDISFCKCSDFKKCLCLYKVPSKEQEFLVDQRRERQMIIAGLDVVTSKLLQRRVARINKIEERKSKEVSKLNLTFVNSNDLDEDKSSSSSSELDDREFVPAKSMKPPSEALAIPSTSQMRVNINKLAVVCDRTGISDRAAAMLSSAVLQDVGIITLEDQSKVIDRSKIRRARKNVRKAIQNKEVISDIEGIYFDGRKDKTITFETIEQKMHKKIIVEEHIVVLCEPGSRYLGHVCPRAGTAKEISLSLFNFLMEKIMLDSVVVIGCDGTVVNTGRKNGIIVQLERKFK